MPSAVEEASADAPVLRARMNGANLTPEDAELVNEMNAIVDRMRTFTPQDPYLLTIPQDVEPRYHHAYQYHAYQYMQHTPFDRADRENMQYQTFHFHEPGKDMFFQEISRQEETLQETNRPRVARAAGTGSNTPNVKKMSLNAYKKKHAGTPLSVDPKPAGEAAIKQPAVKGPIERVKETAQVLAAITADEAPAPAKPGDKDLKRKAESSRARTDESADPAPAAKRPRKASPPPPAPKSPNMRNQPLGNVKTARSPPRKVVAPVSQPVEVDLPPRLSPLQVEPLPARLSPTLPDNICASLKAREKVQKEGKPGKEIIRERTTPPGANKTARAISSPRRYDSHVTSSPPLAPQNKSPAPNGVRSEETALGRLVEKPGADAKLSLIVKLKCKKASRKALRDILKLRPKPWSKMRMATNQIEIDSISDEGLPQTSQRTGPRGEKRRSADAGSPSTGEASEMVAGKEKISTENAAKRGPTTPPPPRVQSPALAKIAAQATPGMRKDASSVAMGREQSNDSNMNTPSAQLTNAPATQVNGAMKAPSSKTSIQQVWEAEQKQLDPLGRGLKHAATDLLAHTATGPVSENTRKLAAVKAVESMLCYVLAFTCAEQAARAAEPKGIPPIRLWRSLPPFLNFVRKYCDRYPALMGIACSLAVTVNARIIEISYQKVGESLPPEKVLEVNAAMHKAAQQSEETLNVDLIMDMFPRAWAARAKGSGIVSSKPRGPGKLGGPYKLPIGLHTPPLLAARACHMMLDEWVRSHSGLDYRLNLKLDA